MIKLFGTIDYSASAALCKLLKVKAFYVANPIEGVLKN